MRRARAAAGRAVAQVTGRALGPYQSAVVRIGFSATWLFFLLREFPNRHELYGPDGPWSFGLAERLIDSNHAFTVLMWSDSGLWFETVYAVSVLSSVLLMLGWRTRAMSVVFMAGVLSLQNRSVFMGDGGDNVIHLMAMYLVLTRCAQVWSLDARRARLRGSASAGAAGPVLWGVLGAVFAYGAVAARFGYGWLAAFAALWVVCAVWWMVDRFEPEGEGRAVLDVLANLVHNAGLLVIMAEVCLIYATAGWYKIQGSRWQDGTALYYPLGLDYFTPWPELSSVVAGSGTLVMLLSYGTVAVQVAFPFTVFNRRIKNVLLGAMMLEHAGIAVMLGLPFFSLAMIAADAVFLPTVFLVWVGAKASGLVGSASSAGAVASAGSAAVPAEAGRALAPAEPGAGVR
ncbi:HTTM domain-containing protein [Streptomyces sp. NBC_00320]|uniref:HTTM domain-containing protein n=1 Tax=Streptomyces sp. NBC_00320 TaxID=2975711 RepID=UPI002259E5B0|nr:HTTM domain-containing protein [Streptomyces sp. NBC_00320]MCX5146661.1 HTTM domain-containing protein [Streptomyces sp. NBC_00320]